MFYTNVHFRMVKVLGGGKRVEKKSMCIIQLLAACTKKLDLIFSMYLFSTTFFEKEIRHELIG